MFASPTLQDNKEIAAVKENGQALSYVSHLLKDDKDVVLAAVNQQGTSLHYASPRLKDNDQVVMNAFSQNPESLYYASPRLKKTIKKGGKTKKRAKKLKDDQLNNVTIHSFHLLILDL